MSGSSGAGYRNDVDLLLVDDVHFWKARK